MRRKADKLAPAECAALFRLQGRKKASLLLVLDGSLAKHHHLRPAPTRRAGRAAIFARSSPSAAFGAAQEGGNAGFVFTFEGRKNPFPSITSLSLSSADYLLGKDGNRRHWTTPGRHVFHLRRRPEPRRT